MIISFKEAGEILEVSDTVFHSNQFNKYRDFVHKGEGFDLEGFRKRESKLNNARIAAKHFLEYLNKVEEMSYPEISKISGIHHKSLGRALGIKSSMKLLINFAKYDQYIIERFDSYNFVKSSGRYNLKNLEKIGQKEKWMKDEENDTNDT